MKLTPNQLTKLRQLARLAGELNADQRQRTDAYQDSIDYQQRQRYRLSRLESEVTRLRSSMKPAALKAAQDEIASLKILIEQAHADGLELQKALARVRAFAGPLNATIDKVTKLAGTSRSELGISFGVRGASTSQPDIVR